MSHESENTSQSMQKPHKKSHNKWKEVLQEEEVISNTSEDSKAAQKETTEEGTEDNTANDSTENVQELSEYVLRTDYNALQAKLDDLTVKLQEAKDEALYTKAAMQNEYNRLREDHKRDKLREIEKIIGSLLPFLDSTEASLTQATTFEHFQEGTKQTLSQLQDIFGKLGVTVVDPEAGALFDPKVHSAVSTEIVENQPVDTIVRVYQKGYKLHERLVRSAMVVVSAPKKE